MSSSTDSQVQAGTVLEGKYRLQQELGAGGMGQVFLARHETIERTVAIKVLHQELANDESVRRRFKTEAKAIGRLRHPNCVMLYEFGFSDEIEALFAVFEYVEGRSLEEWVGKQLPIGDVIELGQQVADGMDHAHNQKIIHRDLKPENIMVVGGEHRPEIKVLDFGIARLAEDDAKRTRLTQVGQMFGTPPYMSPEQVRAQLNVTFATDIYAIGIILYEMLEGNLPFLGDTPIETVMMHLNDEVPPMKRKGLPQGLVDIVMRCLEKDADDRYESCAALKAALVGLEWSSDQESKFGVVGGGQQERVGEDSDDSKELKSTVEAEPETVSDGQDKSAEGEGGSASIAEDTDQTDQGSSPSGGDKDSQETPPSDEEIGRAPTMMSDEIDNADNTDSDDKKSAAGSSGPPTTQDVDDSSEDDRVGTLVPTGQRKVRIIFAAVAIIFLLSLVGVTALVLIMGDDEQPIDGDDPQVAEAQPIEDEQDQAQERADDQDLVDDELAAATREADAAAAEAAEEEEADEEIPPEEDSAASGGESSASEAPPAQIEEPSPAPEPGPTPTVRQEDEDEDEEEEEPPAEQASEEPTGPTGIGLDRRRRGGSQDEESEKEQAEEPEGIRLPGRD